MIGARIMSLRFKMSVGAGVLMVFFLLPAVGFAQQLARSPSGLVPCGAVSGFSEIFRATECGLCDLVKLFGNINNFLLGVTIPISIALFAWAGVMYFAAGGNPKQIIRAHHIFKSVVIGFIIALAAWLIVQTILNALVNRSIFTSGSWNTLVCAGDSQRKRDSNVSDIFRFITGNTQGGGGGIQVGGQTPVAPGTGTPQPGFQIVSLMTTGPGGSPVSTAFSTSRDDADLGGTYENVMNTYRGQIESACVGSVVPNCAQVVAATITVESSGRPDAVSATGARGLMQGQSGATGSNCGATDTTCQIVQGTNYLNTLYNLNQINRNLSNTIAAYNTGPCTGETCSATGKKAALGTSNADLSIGCGANYYAWQCSTQPDGLVDTQRHVANFCRTLSLKGGVSC